MNMRHACGRGCKRPAEMSLLTALVIQGSQSVQHSLLMQKN